MLGGCSGSDSAASTSPTSRSEPDDTELTTSPPPPPTTVAEIVEPTAATAETSEQLLTHPITVADEPCPDGLVAGLRCGLATVPLDWTAPDGETLSIWYGVQPAATQPATATFIPLEGGPGEAISETLADFQGFANGLTSSDTLFVDVRGVGRSSRVSCAAFDQIPFPVGAVADCAAELGSRRNYFNTVSSVLDVEAIRRELGLNKPSLTGVSYGTFVASIYAALFPEQVQSVVLDGAFPLDTNAWGDDITQAIAESASLQCERSGECDPDTFLAELADVAAELQASPRQIAGRPSPLDEGDLINLIQAGLQTASRELRQAISAASAGDYTQLEAFDRVSRTAGGAPDPDAEAPAVNVGGSLGLGVAVICQDYRFPYDIADDPATRRAEFDAGLAALPDDAFAPFSKAGWIDAVWDHPDECLDWPVPSTPSELLAPIDGPFPEIPVLLFNGDLDLQTPLSGARLAQQQWPSSVLVEPVNGTHVVTIQSPCLQNAVVEFLTRPTLPDPQICAGEPLPLPVLDA